MAEKRGFLPRSIGFTHREWDAITEEARALSREVGMPISASAIVRRCVRDKLGLDFEVADACEG